MDRPDQGEKHEQDDDEEESPFLPLPERLTAPLESDAQHHEREDAGPDEIELLLDSKRPEMEKRRGRLRLSEVVGSARGEVEVRGERRRREAVTNGLARAQEVGEEEDRGVRRD